jgi:hypothetical protein
MKWLQLAPIALALTIIGTQDARAELLGVTQTFPDVTLTTSPYLIYDHNGVNASTGRLVIVTGSATLAEGPSGSGNTSVVQSYLGAGDSIPDLVLTLDVNNVTGALLGGSVSIGFGNATGAPRFSWQGAVTNFGFAAPGSTGNIFDATWTMTSDEYQNMPAGLSQFVNGYLTGGSGGIKINSVAAWGAAANFGNDWVFGANAGSGTNGNPFLAAFTGGLTNPLRVNTTIQADVFASPVPVPAAVWLFVSALGLLTPMARRAR